MLIGEASLPIEQLMAYYGDKTAGLPPAVQLPPDQDAVGAAGDRGADRAIRARARRRPRTMAELGARQSRPLARREPDRARAGARRRDAVADLARHADDLSGRRDRHGGCADPDAGGAGPVGEERARARPRTRSRTHADAMGREREGRLHQRRAVAAALERSCGRQCAAAARRKSARCCRSIVR